MPSSGELYRDLGGDYFQCRDPERTIKSLVAKIEALGHTVTLDWTRWPHSGGIFLSVALAGAATRDG